MAALVIYTGQITNTSAPVVYRDPLMDGANGGVLGIFDLAYYWCYPGTSPASGSVIKDIAGIGAGSLVVEGDPSASKIPVYAGGGFDFSGLTARGSAIVFPTEITAHIVAQSLQYFAEVAYIRLPAESDWPSAVKTISGYTTELGGFTTEPDLVTIGMAIQSGSGAKNIRCVRTPLAGSYDELNVTPTSSYFGKVCQIAYWRDATGQHLRVRAAGLPDLTATRAVGAKTTQVLAGKSPRIGVGSSFWAATPESAKNFRVYRKFWEDLELSGRSAAAVIDADWIRVLERAVFS